MSPAPVTSAAVAVLRAGLLAALLAVPAAAQQQLGQFELTRGDEQETWYVMRTDDETPRSGFEGAEDEGAEARIVAQPRPVPVAGERTMTLELSVAPGVDRPRATEATLTLEGPDGAREAQDLTVDLASVQYDALTLALSGTFEAELDGDPIDGFFQATIDQRTPNPIGGTGETSGSGTN